jgi:hypothetical protein
MVQEEGQQLRKRFGCCDRGAVIVAAEMQANFVLVRQACSMQRNLRCMR